MLLAGFGLWPSPFTADASEQISVRGESLNESHTETIETVQLPNFN